MYILIYLEGERKLMSLLGYLTLTLDEEIGIFEPTILIVSLTYLTNMIWLTWSTLLPYFLKLGGETIIRKSQRLFYRQDNYNHFLTPEKGERFLFSIFKKNYLSTFPLLHLQYCNHHLQVLALKALVQQKEKAEREWRPQPKRKKKAVIKSPICRV